MSLSHLKLDWPAYAEEIGRRVAICRRLRKVSQIDLANAIGISRSHLQNIERSRSVGRDSDGNASVHILARIAQALNVPLTALMPQGLLLAEYREIAQAGWRNLEAELAPIVQLTDLPDVVKRSSRVS